MPKVSVIIPTHNRVELLKRSVDSVCRQLFKDWELIIADDYSFDGTPDYLWQLKDSRISWLRTEYQTGSSAIPRNLAIEKAKGEYIALLDSDDIWDSRYLEKMVGTFDSLTPDIGVLYCGVNEINNGLSCPILPKERGNLYPYMLGVCVGWPSASLIRKSVFDDVGLFESNFKTMPHWEMWIRISKKYQFEFVNEILVDYVSHTGQFTRANNIEALANIFIQFDDDYKKHPIEKRKALRYLAGDCLKCGKKISYIRYYFPYLWNDALSIRNIIHFILNFISPKLDKLVNLLYQKLFVIRPKLTIHLPPGDLSEDDASCIVNALKSVRCLYGECLEIGSNLGRSSVLIASHIKNSTLYCIDIWSNEVWEDIASDIGDNASRYPARDNDAFNKFWQNMVLHKVNEKIVAMRMKSEAALKTFRPRLKFIFIDGCHEYEYVKKDIEWVNHLVKGGVVVFHDYKDGWTGVDNAVMDFFHDSRFMEIERRGCCIAFKRRSE